MKNWWKQWLLVTPGIFLADWMLDGVSTDEWWLLLIVGAVLSALNVVLKPLIILFALPFVIFTLGFGIVLINALLVYLAGAVTPGVEVDGFGAAFWTGLIISLCSALATVLFDDKQSRFRMRVNIDGRRRGPAAAASQDESSSRGPRPIGRRDDVIDV